MNEGLVNVCERYIRKGDKLYLEGKLETRKYTDKNGSDAYVTEVVLRPYAGELVMLSGKRDSSTQQETHKGFDAQGDYAAPSGGIDDEIPFN
jgi:single-strand DNA-binding protein